MKIKSRINAEPETQDEDMMVVLVELDDKCQSMIFICAEPSEFVSRLRNLTKVVTS